MRLIDKFNFMINFIKKNFFFLFFIIAFLHVNNFFYNSFSILNRSYEERMIRSYGYCEKESYGFIKKSYEIVQNGNILVVNFEDHLWPNINNIFIDLKSSINHDYTIFLNLKNYEKLIENNSIMHRREKFSFNPKNIIYRNSNCYLVKND